MVWMVHCALGRTGPPVGRSTWVGPSGSESRLLSWLVMTMGNRIHHGVTSVKYTVSVQFDVSNAVHYYGPCGYCVGATSTNGCRAAGSPGRFCCGTHRRPSICQIQ